MGRTQRRSPFSSCSPLLFSVTFVRATFSFPSPSPATSYPVFWGGALGQPTAPLGVPAPAWHTWGSVKVCGMSVCLGR